MDFQFSGGGDESPIKRVHGLGPLVGGDGQVQRVPRAQTQRVVAEELSGQRKVRSSWRQHLEACVNELAEYVEGSACLICSQGFGAHFSTPARWRIPPSSTRLRPVPHGPVT